MADKQLIDYLNSPGGDGIPLTNALVGLGLASADQGQKADTALQPSDVGTTVASSDALSQLSHSSIQVNDIILGGSF